MEGQGRPRGCYMVGTFCGDQPVCAGGWQWTTGAGGAGLMAAAMGTAV